MERFVIGAALFAAAAIAVGSYFGHAVSNGEGFSFVINDDDDAKGSGTPATATPQSYAGTSLRIRNAVAVVTIVPEDRADISIGITNPGKLAMPTVRASSGEVVIDGGLRMHSYNCDGPGFNVDLRGVGHIGQAQMPVITAHVPRDVKLSTSGAVKSSIGPAGAATLAFSGCADVNVGDVAGALDLSNSGSGDVQVGATQSIKLANAGSGDTTVRSVAGRAELSLAGSGDAEIESATGPLKVSIAGSGDASVNGGAIADAEISIAGSGGVNIGAPVQNLDVSIAGSGDVAVKGAAQNVKANIMGSGDVSVGSVSGQVEKTVLGSGTVSIGN